MPLAGLARTLRGTAAKEVGAGRRRLRNAFAKNAVEVLPGQAGPDGLQECPEVAFDVRRLGSPCAAN